MKRIVIHGAKPDSVLPDADSVYCANASFLSREREFSKYPDRVVVASSGVLAKGLRENVVNYQVYKRKLDAVCNFESSRIALFSFSRQANAVLNVKNHILQSGRDHNVEVISVRDRIELVKTVANVGYPLIDDGFLRQPWKIRMRDRFENWKCEVNWKFGDCTSDVRAKYRPSTGILALLLAISENGPDAEYILSGIGIHDRNIYKFKNEKVVMTKNSQAVLPRHTRADLAVLSSLSKSNHISTTENELAGYVGFHR
ncbi:MAG: hypothetical protein KUG58_05910 [Marinosulfonomonas sp.]|nr:hypothetical protein [Marinosulfonomonas sp.]